MHLAVNSGSKNIMLMLINNDINHFQKNKENMNPLELAQNKNSDIYAYLSNLLAEKEKKNVKNKQ